MKPTQLAISNIVSKVIISGLVSVGTLPAAAGTAHKKPAQQPAKFASVRKPASVKDKKAGQPLMKVVAEEKIIEHVVDGKMDNRENLLQNCLVELKVPTIYEANVNNHKQMVEIFESADAKKTVYTFSARGGSSGNLDVENFMKSAAYNRLLKELRAKEEIAAQMKKPNIFQKALGIETGYDKLMKKYEYAGEQCAQFMSSIGRQKFAAELRQFIDAHQKNLMALKGKQPQPMNLSYYVKGAPRPGLASLSSN